MKSHRHRRQLSRQASSPVEDSVETEEKYHMAAGRRIAMRTITSSTDTLHWLISDHLSSTTIITDESGTIVSEMKYTAFGEIRDINGTSPTDYESKQCFDFKAIPTRNRSYTGKRKEIEFGSSYWLLSLFLFCCWFAGVFDSHAAIYLDQDSDHFFMVVVHVRRKTMFLQCHDNSSFPIKLNKLS